MKKSFIILLFILISNNIYSQSGWFWQNMLPQGNTLNSVKFVNSQTGFAVGNLGTIMKTTDAGESWNVLYLNSSGDLTYITNAEESTLYICGEEGTFKTTNSGISWNNIYSATVIKCIYFIDNLTGYACGDGGKILKTTSAGNNWTELASGVGVMLNTIMFKDANTGIAAGDSSTILRTTNAGENWSKRLGSLTGHWNAVTFINDNTGYVAGGSGGNLNNGYMRRTTNAGLTWLIQSITSAVGEITSFDFINSGTGFASARKNSFLKTTNGGLNWIIDYTITNDTYDLNSLCMTGTKEGYLVGTYGTIFKSTTGGNVWTLTFPEGEHKDYRFTSFPNSNTGYISGPFENQILKTTNGGNNWLGKKSQFIFNGKVSFLDPSTGYGIDQHLYLIKTTDGAATWHYAQTTPDSTSNFQFVTSETGYRSLFGDLSRTTNGGLNWTNILFTPYYLYCYYFLSTDVGFAVTTHSELYKTTNKGTSWQFIGNTYSDSLISYPLRIYFPTESTGFLINFRSDDPYVFHLISKTSNGGLNWNIIVRDTQIVDPYHYYLYNIKFFNQDIGFVTGNLHHLLKTTNQGENWFEYRIADRSINDIAFVDDYTGYIVGDGGLIKKTTNGGMSFVQNISGTIPENFILYQNYPNPFNPVTKIKFDVPQSNVNRQTSNVRLIIYNILGKEIKELVNEKLSAGSYETEFNGSNFPSGIYFYKIMIGDFEQTRKMILLK